MDTNARRVLNGKASRAEVKRLREQVKDVADTVAKINAGRPRHTEFTLTNIATGTGTTQDVTWNVPIPGDYSITVNVVCAAAAVGLVTGAVQAGSKTAAGCTIIVANRTGSILGTAAFDVLATPL